MASDYAVRFTAREKAELVPVEADRTPLGPHELAGRTLVSLVSSGTETVGSYAGHHSGTTPASYPKGTGYAAVFQVAEVGSEVTDVGAGDIAFGCGNHRSWQRASEKAVVKVPDGVAPEVAVFARMIKISMPAFVHTQIRPPEIAVVTGLGVVGLMAAQVAAVYGYDLAACEPNARRREIARQHGLDAVLERVPLDDERMRRQVGLGLECSGHEQATLDLCNVVRPRGEVFLVGVPWLPRTDMLAQKILHSVFYNYVNLRGGWEGQMPEFPDPHSQRAQFTTALGWLREGKVRVADGVYRRTSPSDPQTQYQDILHNRLDELTVLFDWREL